MYSNKTQKIRYVLYTEYTVYTVQYLLKVQLRELFTVHTHSSTGVQMTTVKCQNVDDVVRVRIREHWRKWISQCWLYHEHAPSKPCYSVWCYLQTKSSIKHTVFSIQQPTSSSQHPTSSTTIPPAIATLQPPPPRVDLAATDCHWSTDLKKSPLCGTNVYVLSDRPTADPYF